MCPKDEEHYFTTYQATSFAAKNLSRFIEFYSDTRDDTDDYRIRHAVYHVLADPNK
jgi:hypothetical protein